MFGREQLKLYFIMGSQDVDGDVQAALNILRTALQGQFAHAAISPRLHLPCMMDPRPLFDYSFHSIHPLTRKI